MHLQVGFDLGDKIHFYQVPDSGNAGIINITSYSNVGIPGKFIFRLGAAGNSSNDIETPGMLKFANDDSIYFQ